MLQCRKRDGVADLNAGVIDYSRIHLLLMATDAIREGTDAPSIGEATFAFEIMYQKVHRLLAICEAENDFWPNARHFMAVGEHELAFRGIYLYLLERSDLWGKHHGLIKAIRRGLAQNVDFDALELGALDDGMYDESRSLNEWREEMVQAFEGWG